MCLILMLTGSKKCVVLFIPKHLENMIGDYIVVYDGVADGKGSFSNWVDVRVYGFGGHRTVDITNVSRIPQFDAHLLYVVP